MSSFCDFFEVVDQCFLDTIEHVFHRTASTVSVNFHHLLGDILSRTEVDTNIEEYVITIIFGRYLETALHIHTHSIHVLYIEREREREDNDDDDEKKNKSE